MYRQQYNVKKRKQKKKKGKKIQKKEEEKKIIFRHINCSLNFEQVQQISPLMLLLDVVIAPSILRDNESSS